MTQEHVQKQTAKQSIEQTAAVEAKDERNQRLADDVVDMLDEIDEVLETNAEEFVRSFVQKGGE